jgi:hypothetical protein
MFAAQRCWMEIETRWNAESAIRKARLRESLTSASQDGAISAAHRE